MILGWKVKKKNDLTKTFIKLGNMPKSDNSNDKNTIEFIVKTFYFGNVKNIENMSSNGMKKRQFSIQTIYFK